MTYQVLFMNGELNWQQYYETYNDSHLNPMNLEITLVLTSMLVITVLIALSHHTWLTFGQKHSR